VKAIPIRVGNKVEGEDFFDRHNGFERERIQFLSFLLRDYWKRNHA